MANYIHTDVMLLTISLNIFSTDCMASVMLSGRGDGSGTSGAGWEGHNISDGADFLMTSISI